MLTKQQRKLLLIIHNYIQAQGIAPSFDEMFRAMDLHSKSGVHRLLDCLVEREFIRRIKNRARAIEVIKLPADIPLDRSVGAFEVTERAKEALGFSGIKFIVNPSVPEGEVWINARHGYRDVLTKFAVSA